MLSYSVTWRVDWPSVTPRIPTLVSILFCVSAVILLCLNVVILSAAKDLSVSSPSVQFASAGSAGARPSLSPAESALTCKGSPNPRTINTYRKQGGRGVVVRETALSNQQVVTASRVLHLRVPHPFAMSAEVWGRPQFASWQSCEHTAHQTIVRTQRQAAQQTPRQVVECDAAHGSTHEI
jgi:hypothetical protein